MHPFLFGGKILVYFSREVWYTIMVKFPRGRHGGAYDGFWRRAAAHHISKLKTEKHLAREGPHRPAMQGRKGKGPMPWPGFGAPIAPHSVYIPINP